MEQRFYSFNRYLRDKFGGRVHRISLNAGFSCPNLDGTKSGQGCIFCNNRAFGYFVKSELKSLDEQIIQAIEFARHRYKAEKYIAYFQSFSNTYGDIDFLKEKYGSIRKFDNLVGLAISTRPDCVNEEKLDILESFTKDYAVYLEYGLQTVHDKTLKLINTNYTFDDFKKSVELTKKRKNINIGVHLILGLPGETKEDVFRTIQELSQLPLWGVKLHCLHVVKDTKLEEMYHNQEVKLLAEDEYVDILADCLKLMPKNWVILRLVSDADRDLLIAPLWLNQKQRVLKKLEEELQRKNIYQGKNQKLTTEN